MGVEGGRVVSWLHISDLHFGPTREYERWTVLNPLIERALRYREEGSWKPDLIFVTGDIANRGADNEYLQAGTFFDKLLDACHLGKERLFVVPGNHDVDRTEGRLLERSLYTEKDSDDFFGMAPEKALYLSKVRAFREWHERYFDKKHATDPFSGCSPPKVVTIRDTRVAILPLSTAIFCQDDSDHGKLWIGRRWLDNAMQELELLDADLRIGLHHHPLDWLHDVERGQIKTQLARHMDILLRGHLHETDVESIASASRAGVMQIAAGATHQEREWPKRAIYARAYLSGQPGIQIHPIRYEKDPNREWTLDTSIFPEYAPFTPTLPLPSFARRAGLNGAETTLRPRSSTELHSRKWVVSTTNGIAEVQVELRNVVVQDELVIAMPTPPYCNIAPGRLECVCDAGDSPELLHNDYPDGRQKYRVIGSRKIKQLRFSYFLSNAMALNVFENQCLGPRHDWFPKESDGYEGRPHVVRFDSDRLILSYEFPEGAPRIDDTQARVEKLDPERGWVRFGPEAKRCRVTKTDSTCQLDVERPLFGYRYTLLFRPGSPGLLIKPRAASIIDRARDVLRKSYPTPPLLAAINASLDRNLEAALESTFGTRTAYVGFLWHPERSVLLASFGRFPAKTWSVRFKFGNGVAGHAFRFARLATWAKDDTGSKQTLIFQPKTSERGPDGKPYEWIVAVPLLLQKDGPAIGIVSFASTTAETRADHTLRDLALNSSRAPNDPDVIFAQGRLVSATNVGFWVGLQAREGNPSGDLNELAESALAGLDEGTVERPGQGESKRSLTGQISGSSEV